MDWIKVVVIVATVVAAGAELINKEKKK